jgi:hypothetical protein
VTRNPFDPAPDQTSKLSAEEQAEYDRLAAEEAKSTQAATDGSAVPELDQGDEETEERYPVENGAVRWDDAANSGDTSREQTAVYDTPWGRRELSATEVTDFEAQGVPITRVDAEPRTSLDAEREELRKIELTNKNADTTGH